MNQSSPWALSAAVHAVLLGAAAFFGAALVVDQEMTTKRGRTVVELQASVQVQRPEAETSRIPPAESRPFKPFVPGDRASEIVRREPVPVVRAGDVASARPITPLPSGNPPPPTRVETNVPEPETVAEQRPPAATRPLAVIETPAVAATTGSSDIDELPTVLFNPDPAYPGDAYAAGVEGVVTLDVVIDTQGRASEVRISRSSGSVSLDHAALRTVRDIWRFSIARRGGVPVPYQREVPVRFRIGDR